MYDAPFVCLLPFPYFDFLIFGGNHVMMFGQAGMADEGAVTSKHLSFILYSNLLLQKYQQARGQFFVLFLSYLT